MLDDLVEIETPDAIAAAAQRIAHPGACTPENGFQGLDYLFWGRAAGMPGVWIAGGVTVGGYAVTGSGTDLTSALWGVLGETAEAHCRFGAKTNNRSGPVEADLDRGYGAHVESAQALTHARHEAVERQAVRQWWRGRRPAHLLPDAQVGAALRALGVEAPCTIVALQIGVGRDLSVIFAADFEADGGSFCFGAACRDVIDQALQDALLELCQSRFSLALSRMKQQRFGPSGLVAGDRANLLMADRIGRADVLRLVGAGASSAAPQMPWPTTALLGTYCGLLQVAMARLDPDTPAPGQGVLGILCPYTGAT